jgi:hypothetical protein
VVTDAEAVAEGESPLASGEDGVAARSEDDVHRPEELWLALLHQHDLTRGSTGGIDHSPDYVGSRREMKLQASKKTRSSRKRDCDTPNLQQIQSARYVFHHNPRIIVVTYIT